MYLELLGSVPEFVGVGRIAISWTIMWWLFSEEAGVQKTLTHVISTASKVEITSPPGTSLPWPTASTPGLSPTRSNTLVLACQRPPWPARSVLIPLSLGSLHLALKQKLFSFLWILIYSSFWTLEITLCYRYLHRHP